MSSLDAQAPSGEVQVQFTIDQAGLAEMEKLRTKLGSRNLATMLYNAVTILNQLYEYQAQGYQLAIIKRGEFVQNFTLPIAK